MRKIYLLMVAFALIMSACNSNKVKIRGEVQGLNGTVKLLVQIPARVWIDIDGKNTLTTIVDTKDQLWVEGKIKFPDQIEVKGSYLDGEYDKLKKLFKEKYEGPIEPIDKNIQKLMAKEKRTANDEVMLGVFMLQRQRYIKARANYVRDLIKANPTQELSLILLQDELQDSTDLQKRLFKAIKVVNKESNLYKTTAEKMQ